MPEEILPQVRAHSLGHPFQVDVDAEDANRLEAVEPVLGGSCEAWQLNLQLADLADGQRDDQKDEAGEHDDDGDENGQDGQHAGHAGRVQADDRGLNQEGDRRPEHEGAEEVAEQVQNHDRDEEGGDTEGDLQVATAPPGIESPCRDRDPADRGWALEFSLAGRSRVRARTHFMQPPAV